MSQEAQCTVDAETGGPQSTTVRDMGRSLQTQSTANETSPRKSGASFAVCCGGPHRRQAKLPDLQALSIGHTIRHGGSNQRPVKTHIETLLGETRRTEQKEKQNA